MLEQFQYEEKVWGKVAHLFYSDHTAVSHLRVKAGYRCSRHFHRERVNMFAVVSGGIIVEEWPVGEQPVETVLVAGDVHTVPFGMLHRFRVVRSGEVIEVYWPASDVDRVRLDDIERLDVGGPC